jgi:hypothetical protein
MNAQQLGPTCRSCDDTMDMSLVDENLRAWSGALEMPLHRPEVFVSRPALLRFIVAGYARASSSNRVDSD